MAMTSVMGENIWTTDRIRWRDSISDEATQWGFGIAKPHRKPRDCHRVIDGTDRDRIAMMALPSCPKREAAGCVGFDEMNADWRQKPCSKASDHPAAIRPYSLFNQFL
jgi:hypothetical protein